MQLHNRYWEIYYFKKELHFLKNLGSITKLFVLMSKSKLAQSTTFPKLFYTFERSMITKKTILLTKMKTVNSIEDNKVLIKQRIALYHSHLVMIIQYFVFQNLYLDANINKFKHKAKNGIDLLML